MDQEAYQPILRAAAEELARQPRVLITVDGPCASGKTTLAEKLSGILGAAVIHTDDPNAWRSPAATATGSGWCVR